MPDQSPDVKKTAIKIAMGAALGGALGIAAAKQAAGGRQLAAEESNEQQAGVLQDTSNEVGAVLEPPSPPQHSALSTQHSPTHPDWEMLPAAHLPRPTYWPVVLAVGIMFLAWGIVTTVAISVIGLALLALALGGWIGELRHDH